MLEIKVGRVDFLLMLWQHFWFNEFSRFLGYLKLVYCFY